jgi:tetratricopeptide (TPR) repeat protein
MAIKERAKYPLPSKFASKSSNAFRSQTKHVSVKRENQAARGIDFEVDLEKNERVPSKTAKEFPLFPAPAWISLGTLLVVVIATSLIFRVMNPQWILLRKATTALQANDPEDAAIYLKAARETGKDQAGLEMRAATLAVQLKDFDTAGKALESVLRKNPKSLEASTMLAGTYQHFRKPEQALHVLLAAQQAGAKLTPEAKLQMADLYRELHLYPEAQSLYGELLKIPSVARTATTQFAEMLAWQKKYPEALALLRGLLESDPSDSTARLALARVLSWSGQTEESVRQYEILLKK